MITYLKVNNFKCLTNEDLQLKPLTIISGVNSSGKSSLIQSILVPIKLYNRKNATILQSVLSSFDAIKNKYTNAKSVNISYGNNESSFCEFFRAIDYKDVMFPEGTELIIEDNLYYLSANRLGAESLSQRSDIYSVGLGGEFLLNTYENEKGKMLNKELVKDLNSFTLSYQVDSWLSYILDVPLKLSTEKVSEESVKVSYTSDGLPNLVPSQLGAGVGYLTKILIMCLRAKKDDVLIIENPEIHLHPAAQAKLADFFVFISNAGIQLIVETHCEHLINKLQFLVYKHEIEADKVTLLYKKSVHDSFMTLEVNNNGSFNTDFPDGFFDATLAEMLEME